MKADKILCDLIKEFCEKAEEFVADPSGGWFPESIPGVNYASRRIDELMTLGEGIKLRNEYLIKREE